MPASYPHRRSGGALVLTLAMALVSLGHTGPTAYANDCSRLTVLVGGTYQWLPGAKFEESTFGHLQERHTLMPLQTRGEAFCLGFPPNANLYLRAQSTDIKVAKDVFAKHEFAFLDDIFGSAHLPHTILDLGANTGLVAFYLAKRFPKARIASVEASLENFKMLAINTHAVPNVQPIHAAVWNETTFARITRSRLNGTNNEWGFTVQPTKEVAGAAALDVIPAVTVAQLLQRLEWGSVSYLKMDVEGAENTIFANPALASVWLEKVHWMSIEIHEKKGFPIVNRAMDMAGFELVMTWKKELSIYRNKAWRHTSHRIPGNSAKVIVRQMTLA